MNANPVEILKQSLGVAAPLRFSLLAPNGKQPAYLEFDSPFVILGRSGDCHISIPQPTVSYRHLYFQVIHGRVLCLDLFTANGTKWDGPASNGWLSPEHRLEIGGHTVQLFDDGWVFDAAVPSPLEFRPRKDAPRPEFGLLPLVHLELVGGARQEWPINRVMTLIGRDERCRIKIIDDQISKVHCSLLLLPSGLWAVDLLGRNGIQVDDVACACQFLGHESVMTIGPYKLRTHYEVPPPSNEPLESPSGVIPIASSVPAEVQERAAFLVKTNRIFRTELYGDAIIVCPMGDFRDFFYQDIQVESSRVTQLLTALPYQHVIIDFSQVPLIGSIILDACIAFCRNARGRAALCSATPDMWGIVQQMNLHNVWPCVNTRTEALQAVFS
jgi:hypothetical protein